MGDFGALKQELQRAILHRPAVVSISDLADETGISRSRISSFLHRDTLGIDDILRLLEYCRAQGWTGWRVEIVEGDSGDVDAGAMSVSGSGRV